jgi:hypothetical protein
MGLSHSISVGVKHKSIFLGGFIMATISLEEMAQTLEKQQKEIQKLKDVYEIQNLMGRYIYLHEVGRDPEFPDTLYAKKTPGVSVEVATSGVFLADKGDLRRAWPTPPGTEPGLQKGALFTHPITTPVIEVAGDGKTAKGVWMSLGYETGADDPQTKKKIAMFEYHKKGVDFVKEDGKWKIWHYHVYRQFMTPWNVPFTDEWERNVRDKTIGKFEEIFKPDLPTTADNPYSQDTVRELVPAPPEPYEKWEDTFSYGP